MAESMLSGALPPNAPDFEEAFEISETEREAQLSILQSLGRVAASGACDLPGLAERMRAMDTEDLSA